ncbi:MAG: transposase [Ardenticatenaceae bacterium]|nr:transposase [Ardenticatenaceae bacterium]
MYINGKRCWLHTVSTSELTYYEPHQSRGKRLPTPLAFCLNSPAPLFTITGRPISKYQLLLHALCNAHHLRELTAVVENDQQQWAALMIACLLAAKQLVAEAIRQVKPNCQSSNCNESTRCMTPLLPSV